MEARDVESVVRYWTEAPPEHLARMGVDPKRIPDAKLMRSGMRAALAIPESVRSAFTFIWEVDGRSVGAATLKRIEPGCRADIHLHMWESSDRRRGLGRFLFALSALEGMERFRLEKLACEPNARNEAPNGMLRKLGLPLVRTYRTSPSELTYEQEVNRYEMTRGDLERAIERCLADYSTSKSK